MALFTARALTWPHLQAMRHVSVPIYDFTRHQRSSQTRRVEPADVVIVEGILVLHMKVAAPGIQVVDNLKVSAPKKGLRSCACHNMACMQELREMLNMKIYVDTDDDLRLARR